MTKDQIREHVERSLMEGGGVAAILASALPQNGVLRQTKKVMKALRKQYEHDMNNEFYYHPMPPVPAAVAAAALMGMEVAQEKPCRFLIAITSPASPPYTKHFAGLNQNCAVGYAQRRAAQKTGVMLECIVSTSTEPLDGNSIFFGPDALLLPPEFAKALITHNTEEQKYQQLMLQWKPTDMTPPPLRPPSIRYFSFAPPAADEDVFRFFIGYSDGTAQFATGSDEVDAYLRPLCHLVVAVGFAPQGNVVISLFAAPYFILYESPRAMAPLPPYVHLWCTGADPKSKPARAIFTHPLIHGVYVCQFRDGTVVAGGDRPEFQYWTPAARTRLLSIGPNDLIKSLSFGEERSSFVVHVVVNGNPYTARVPTTTTTMPMPERGGSAPAEAAPAATGAPMLVAPRHRDAEITPQVLEMVRHSVAATQHPLPLPQPGPVAPSPMTTTKAATSPTNSTTPPKPAIAPAAKSVVQVPPAAGTTAPAKSVVQEAHATLTVVAAKSFVGMPPIAMLAPPAVAQAAAAVQPQTAALRTMSSVPASRGGGAQPRYFYENGQYHLIAPVPQQLLQPQQLPLQPHQQHLYYSAPMIAAPQPVAAQYMHHAHQACQPQYVFAYQTQYGQQPQFHPAAVSSPSLVSPVLATAHPVQVPSPPSVVTHVHSPPFFPSGSG